METLSSKIQFFLEKDHCDSRRLVHPDNCRISRKTHLDRLLVQVFLLARDIVGAHDPALLAGGDLASEHTTEGVEPSLVGGGHHLAHVHHQGTVGVASLDGHASLIVRGSLVQKLSPRRETFFNI